MGCCSALAIYSAIPWHFHFQQTCQGSSCAPKREHSVPSWDSFRLPKASSCDTQGAANKVEAQPRHARCTWTGKTKQAPGETRSTEMGAVHSAQLEFFACFSQTRCWVYNSACRIKHQPPTHVCISKAVPVKLALSLLVQRCYKLWRQRAGNGCIRLSGHAVSILGRHGWVDHHLHEQ